jgi:organic anion transporter 3A
MFAGSIVMGIGSIVFTVPHFIAEPHLASTLANSSSDNICRGVSVREQDMGLGRLSSGRQPIALLAWCGGIP